MNKPLVSITSAFYNTGPMILDMIKSVFAQTFTDWELLLLDDGSTDNTLELVQSIDDPKVKVFTNGQNKGRSFSLNRLTNLANGKYIARMDSDDMSSTTRVEKQVDLIESDKNIDVVGTGMYYLDNKDNPLGRTRPPVSHAEICAHPSRTFNIAHGTILAKKSWFEENKYDETLSYAIDFNLLLRAYEHSKFSNVSTPLYYYRLHSSFSLKKVLIGRLTCAKFLFKHYVGRKCIGDAFYASFMQFVRLTVVFAMCVIGLKKRLLARRCMGLSKKEQQVYEQEIHKIKETKLPIINPKTHQRRFGR